MKTMKDETGWKLLRTVLLTCGLLLILFPLYLVLINAFKTLDEAGRNFFAFPQEMNFDNFRELFTDRKSVV